MEFLYKEATEIFVKLLRLLKDDSFEIKNEPGCPLYIERSLSEVETPLGIAQVYDVCLYYFDGDIFRVPEIGFAVIDKRGWRRKQYDKLKVVPCYLQHDDLRRYETSIKLEGFTLVVCDRELQKQHTDYANEWLINLDKAGYFKK